jgi:hypothetical protein
VLAARLGADHAALLAEPVAAARGGGTDWYARRAGQMLPRGDLTDAERAALDARLETLARDIRGLAAQIAQVGDANSLQLAEALENALQHPRDSDVFALRDPAGDLHPVLTQWAWSEGSATRLRGSLSAVTPRKAAPVDPVAPSITASPASALPGTVPETIVTARGRGWMRWVLVAGWVLLAALIGLILWLLIEPCALRGLAGGWCAPPPGQVSMDRHHAERQSIERQVAALERDLAQAEALCRPVPVAPAPAPAPQPVPEPDEIDRRIDDAGAQRGELNFALIWHNTDDLDLAVTCPSGERISFTNRQVCGGRLDIDANAGARTSTPVENIYFETATPGTYRINVTLFSNRSGAPVPFEVRVRQGTARVETFSGRLQRSNTTWTQSITITR